MARKIYSPLDDPLVNYRNEEGLNIEPDWYVPIIPMVLINGSEGIGTGYSSTIMNYNPADIINNLLSRLKGVKEAFDDMHPWYRGFTGTVEQAGAKYHLTGVYNVPNDTTIVITELPIYSWTQSYKEFLDEAMDTPDKPGFIKDFKEYHTDTTVHFEITLTKETLKELQKDPNGILKKFKLQLTKTVSNMTLYDSNGCLKKYSNVTEIMEEFFDIRLEYYHKRKTHLESVLRADLEKLSNKVRFILGVIDGSISVFNRKNVIVSALRGMGFLEIFKDLVDSEHGFEYLLSMPIWSLTNERVEKMKIERDAKLEELADLESKSAKDLWITDLENLQRDWEVLFY